MKPTYLYIKRHKVTGLRYFGKTIKDPLTYYGSGKYWTRHIKKHGPEHIETLWYQLFTDRDTLVATALKMSEELDVVGDREWANIVIENGIGGPIGLKLSEETKARIAKSRLGKKHSTETKAKMSATKLKHKSKRYQFLARTTPEERIRLRNQSQSARK